jgi:thiol-disulfide isomerase/thioredoxin
LCTVAPAQERPAVPPVVPGSHFPVATLANLNAAAGGPQSIDLAGLLGKKPIILYYWIPESGRSERVFQELQQLVDDLGRDRIALLGVVVPRPGRGVDLIQERIRALKLDVPVLDDAGFRLGQQLNVSSVPNISLLDAKGRLRLTNGASLNQVLGYELDVGQAIRRLAESGDLMTYGRLDRYYPVRELEGRMSPNFEAPFLRTNEVQNWHSLLDDQKLNVLIFWSVDCPHCRESLPEISRWLDQHPEGVNVVSCADVNSVEAMNKTREFCESNQLRFPTLVDNQSKIGGLYKVTTTPTIVIMGPDGVVDSSLVSGYSDFGTKIEDKKRQLLK